MPGAGDDGAMDPPYPPPPARMAELAQVYLRADYFVALGRREWRFRIGDPVPDIEEVLQGASYLFITAWNPVSEDIGLDDNIEADQQLQARLQQAGFPHYSALGGDPVGGHGEHGWLVLDLPRATADLLAGEFRQAGVVYWQRGEPVRLRMQSAQPPDWDGHDCVDWTG